MYTVRRNRFQTPSVAALRLDFEALLSRFLQILRKVQKQLPAKEYARFLYIAEGSLSETQYLILVGRDLGYIPKEVARQHLGETSELLRMLHRLREKIQNDG